MSRTLILVVDDATLTTLLVIQLCNHYGFDIRTANNVKDALNLIAENVFDIVFTDINMPDINGFEFIKMARILDDNLNFVVISADASISNLVKVQELEVKHFMCKPLRIDRVVEIIKELSFKKVKLPWQK